MSSNVGLSTPRGSGTSGYVQRNLSLLKPRSTGVGAPYPPTTYSAPKQRKPDQAILAHDREREIEVKILELRDKLEDDGKDEDEVDEECEKLREKLKKEGSREGQGRKVKGYQVHELAEAKERESERLRRALGLKKGTGEGKDGEEHPMARQDRERRERELGQLSREERQDRMEKEGR